MSLFWDIFGFKLEVSLGYLNLAMAVVVSGGIVVWFGLWFIFGLWFELGYCAVAGMAVVLANLDSFGN